MARRPSVGIRMLRCSRRRARRFEWTQSGLQTKMSLKNATRRACLISKTRSRYTLLTFSGTMDSESLNKVLLQYFYAGRLGLSYSYRVPMTRYNVSDAPVLPRRLPHGLFCDETLATAFS